MQLVAVIVIERRDPFCFSTGRIIGAVFPVLPLLLLREWLLSADALQNAAFDGIQHILLA